MILEHIGSPADLKKVPPERLPEVATEIRQKILDTVTKNGGHLGSGMGVVELTIALHYVYDFPRDRLFLDTGHQCYPHKLLTGRFDRFHTLRQEGGISGFPNIDESEYDLMTSGHAGTAVSVAVGTAVGDALAGDPRRTVAVVGDASVVSGNTFEALNSAGYRDQNLLVILNDNAHSIGKTTGAMARLLSKLRMSKLYSGAKESMHRLEKLVSRIPVIGEKMDRGVHELVDHLKHAFVPGQVFEELGFTYYGIYDGHCLDTMLDVLNTVKDQPGMKLLHVATVKGKGVVGCEEDPLALHGASPGQVLHLDGAEQCAIEKVEPASKETGAPRYDFAKCMAEVLLEQAEQHPEVVAITAGMPDGTGLVPFREKYPDRFFNVGICEQHGAAFAGGLTIGGIKPVFAVYSTFMQRGFDQVFQEIALQRRPVVLVMSHGGVAGDDGPTHHGLFDIALLRAIPGVTLLSPRDGAELQAMFRFSLQQPGPVAIRYPKANTAKPGREVAPLELGKAEVVREGGDVALLAYGAMTGMAEEAAALLAEQGIECLVANMRFARPLDEALLTRVLGEHRLVVTLEEAARNGGFGSAVLEWASEFPEKKAPVHVLAVPDRFLAHGKRDSLLESVGLSANAVHDTVLRLTSEAPTIRTASSG